MKTTSSANIMKNFKFEEKSVVCKLIKYLLRKYKNCRLISVEIPYISMKRRADVLLIDKNNNFVVFEIKTDADNMRRTEEEINDYKKTFDYVYVVCETKYGDYIKKNYKNVGILCVNGNIKEIQKPKIIKHQLKENLSKFLLRRDFCKLRYDKKKSVTELRKKIISTLAIKNIKNMAIDSLLSRYKNRFLIFKQQIGGNGRGEIFPNDLDYLTKPFNYVFVPDKSS
jgi:hypothetical protein